MHVLLVNTNRVRPPIAPVGLDYLGAALRANGHEVALLDLCWEDDGAYAINTALGRESVDAVAVTFRNTDDCYFASGCSFVPQLRRDVACLRECFDGPIVLGGGGFSLMPVELLELTGADYGVCGDGEAALPALLRAFRGELSLAEVPGLIWRAPGAWRRNGAARADPGAFDLTARDVVDNSRYFHRGGQMGIETKRGCPGRCVYCADPIIKGGQVRMRSPADVVSEVAGLVARGIDHLHLCDSEFNLPESHARDVCRAMIDAGLGERIRWYAYASPLPFSAELATLMRRAGCAGINFGADSGSDRMLAALGRKFTVTDLERCVRFCREASIAIMFDLLLGAPGETWETVAETLERMKSLSPDCVGISLGVRVYPGTPLAAELTGSGERGGLIGDPAGVDPAFYLSPALDDEPFARVRSMVAGDERFFYPLGRDDQDYNYNDNAVLQTAIERGARGAYWDILRKLRRPG